MSIWYFGLGPLGACGVGAALGIGEELALAGYDGRIDPHGLAFGAAMGCLVDAVDRLDTKPDDPDTPTPGRPRGQESGGVGDPVPGESLCRSFSGDTGVLMSDGTVKPISEIDVGDVVASADPESRDQRGEEVLAVFVHDDLVVDFATTAGVISTTEDHLFWNETDRQWQQAQEFDPGDLLVSAGGESVRVLGLKWSTQVDQPAYNLDIANLDTYYVVVGDSEVLVHNDETATGIVYLRTDPDTGEEYVGQAKSSTRYQERQREHQRRGGSAYDFEILQDGIEPGDALDAAEEDWIRAGGGRKKEGGRLANVGNPISEERYTEAGGLFPGDSGC
ncbi:MAG: hypothetical protein GY701_30095 [Sulfitobacter sp.]|nr:hypothetical protein [Sulfitobacter sp.]